METALRGSFFVFTAFLRGGEGMKKLIILESIIVTSLIVATPVFAQSADVSKVQNFIENIIQILTTLAGLLASGFFVWGGVRYITSSGNPEALEGAKKTILFSAVGLAITLGAFVLSNIVTQTATGAFGAH